MPRQTLTINDLMPFGKYKGKRMCDIMRDDPSYIVWMYEQGIPMTQSLIDDAIDADTDMLLGDGPVQLDYDSHALPGDYDLPF